ncbi:MAG TPA: hypothetical protein VD997_12110 [Phycisphaerales bacterium]|nr:hypothetical protein [Phycisphaerales bacterium]
MRPVTLSTAAGMAFGLVLASSVSAQQAAFYPLENWYTQAFAVSNDGTTAAGRIVSTNPDAWDAACRWQLPTPTAQELGHLPGTDDSVAFGVSGDGSTIVGASGMDFFDYGYAFRYRNGVMQNLGRLPGGSEYCMANAVSGDGNTIVGEGDNPVWYSVAWRKVGDGPLTVIGNFPGGYETWAMGVSNDGSVIVGSGYDGNDYLRAWKWTAASGIQPLPLAMGAEEAQAFGVSDDGQVVFGAAFGTDFFSEQAVMWTLEAGMEILPAPAGYDGSVAYGSNASGTIIVGNMWHDIFVPEAMIYDVNTGMRRLQDVLVARGATIPADWFLTHAWDISADGRVVVGQAINELGETQGYIATLFPAPGTSPCGTSDFNGDGDSGTDQDIEAFFACIGGNCCPTCWVNGADFNGDGDTATDQDIEAFFRVLGGNPC